MLALLEADVGSDAREVVRELIDEITVTPENGKFAISIVGELVSILALAAAGRITSAF